jgi:tetratricopeptide (TPR) repeat protein
MTPQSAWIARTRALILAASVLLPGAGHVIIGRQFKGILIAFLYTAALMMSLFRLFVVSSDDSVMCDWVFPSSVVAGLGVWLWAFLDLFDTLYGFRRAAPRSEVDPHLRQGAIHYLRGEMSEAERELLLAAKLDPKDADVCIHLARVYQAAGQKRKCRRFLRRCRSLDADAKWAVEIEETANAMRQPPRGETATQAR